MGADEPRMLRLLDVHNQVVQQAVRGGHCGAQAGARLQSQSLVCLLGIGSEL
jgi:hypothetical protein